MSFLRLAGLGNVVADRRHVTDRTRSAPPTDDDTLDLLVSVFYRICDRFALGLEDEAVAREVAQALIQAALSGEDDPDVLYRCALRALIKA